MNASAIFAFFRPSFALRPHEGGGSLFSFISSRAFPARLFQNSPVRCKRAEVAPCVTQGHRPFYRRHLS
jgi:hypothetical protein